MHTPNLAKQDQDVPLMVFPVQAIQLGHIFFTSIFKNRFLRHFSLTIYVGVSSLHTSLEHVTIFITFRKVFFYLDFCPETDPDSLHRYFIILNRLQSHQKPMNETFKGKVINIIFLK